MCPLCLGVDKGPWTGGGLGLLENLKDALIPGRKPEATDEAIAAFNAEAQQRYEAKQEANRVEREKRERAERVRDLIADADPEVIARALGVAQVKPAVRK